MPVKSSNIVPKNGNSRYIVRCMTHEDLPQLMEIRRELKVHDVESCIDSWLTVDPQGINVVESEAGELVGACCFIRNSDDLYFGGLYCVRPKYQGTGLGIHVWNACMDHVGPRNAALNAVPGKTELYRDKSGFPIVETEFKCQKNFTMESVDPDNLSNIIPQGVIIESVQDYHLPAMFDYDFSVVGYDRQFALALNCQEENSRTFVAMKNGDCVGFGTIKLTCLGAGRVGPLYADDPAVAEALLKRLIMSMPHVTGFVMNTVSNNVSARKLLKKLGVPLKEELTRMYRKEKLSADTKKIFALYELNLAPF
ncbi:uncharacterized protein LOC129989826 [Argiope bruennichi]|uniref:N-acetyltransferase domain-containing protein n=1 Tax=Argiope bruennichi TaxID=94029 RepID=A0A8T0FWF5_ARGBR|nr:uncharacterized protein LOC129989826 [Argiope bruennichi]KAF8795042.1 hypothetical protein HNY73_002940 [Argiope bruennichi]